MSIDRAEALTFAAVQQVKHALDEAEVPSDFFAEADAIVARPECRLRLPLDLGSADGLDAGIERGAGRDVENAAKVYQYLGAVDRANASDVRLWSYLAFVTYRDYMEHRWPPEAVKNWKGRIEDRWLMVNASRAALIRHGVARLWWVSELTYDASCLHPLSSRTGNPFAYGEEVLRNEDRVLALFDREVGAIDGLVRSVLELASSGKEHGNDQRIRALMKEITLVYGYRDLEELDKQDMDSLVRELAGTQSR